MDKPKSFLPTSARERHFATMTPDARREAGMIVDRHFGTLDQLREAACLARKAWASGIDPENGADWREAACGNVVLADVELRRMTDLLGRLLDSARMLAGGAPPPPMPEVAYTTPHGPRRAVLQNALDALIAWCHRQGGDKQGAEQEVVVEQEVKGGFWSVPDIAERFRLTEKQKNALQGRLRRWRHKNLAESTWREVDGELGSRNGRFYYNLDAIRSMIDAVSK